MRSYLDIPYIDREEAKELCAKNKLFRLGFDTTKKCWYYPAGKVPEILTKKFPIIAVTDDPAEQVQAHKTTLFSSNTPSHFTPKFEYTPEQKAFIAAEPSGPENLLIARAFAGAAKTTSLRAYTAARPNKRFLYIAFNNSVAKEAQRSFGPNTYSCTVHSLARRFLPKCIIDKVADRLKADALCHALGHKPTNANLIAFTWVLEIIHNYCTSPDSFIGIQHFPASIPEANHDLLIRYARDVWNRMRNPDNPLAITHDVYLKLYALENPVWDYDYALLDEGQDTDGATESIFFAQKIGKIVVGDPHQGIYSFRHARDVLSPRINESCTCCYLTATFRFSQKVADLANLVLKTFKHEEHPIIGKGKNGVIWAPRSPDWQLHFDGKYTQHAIIARSNCELFNMAARAVNMIEAYEFVTGNKAPRLAFVGTSEHARFSPLDTYRFRRLIDMAHLDLKHRATIDAKVAKMVSAMKPDELTISDPFIAHFRSLKELFEYANSHETKDPEILSGIRILSIFKGSVIPLIRKIIFYSVNPQSSDVWMTFSTAHKSKGLEFDRVRLCNDFGKTVDRYGNLDYSSAPEERNLLYVALTRAKAELELNEDLYRLIFVQDKRHLCDNGAITPTGQLPKIIEDERDSFKLIQWINYYRQKLGLPIYNSKEQLGADLAQYRLALKERREQGKKSADPG